MDFLLSNGFSKIIYLLFEQFLILPLHAPSSHVSCDSCRVKLHLTSALWALRTTYAMAGARGSGQPDTTNDVGAM